MTEGRVTNQGDDLMFLLRPLACGFIASCVGLVDSYRQLRGYTPESCVAADVPRTRQRKAANQRKTVSNLTLDTGWHMTSQLLNSIQ